MKCKLCLKEGPLRNSHIIPEFFYKLVYDPKHRFLIIPTSQDGNVGIGQKGIRGNLLCGQCEAYFSKLERYARYILLGFSESSEIRIELNSKNIIVLSNINYKIFKLFQLSILWRASVSSDPFFSLVELGPHEEKIRKMLINGDPGKSHEYGCVMIIVIHKNEPFGLIEQPECRRDESHRYCRFLFGGIVWLYVTSSHSKEYKMRDLFLTEYGLLRVGKSPLDKLDFLIKLAGNIGYHEDSINYILNKGDK